jgi:hypothetical protein
MRKKLMILAAVVVCGGTGLAWSLSAPEAVGLSRLKANPEQYVGKVRMTALAGRNDASQGLLEVADEKACCTLVLDIPFTREQQATRKTTQLYAGALPEKGTPLEVLGTLSRMGAGYAFTVERISSGGKVLVKRI